jgi:hypothetical protein
MNHTDKTGGEAVILSDNSSFKEVVDEACSRLWDRKVRYSIGRIQEREGILDNLEGELDLLIQNHSVQ